MSSPHRALESAKRSPPAEATLAGRARALLLRLGGGRSVALAGVAKAPRFVRGHPPAPGEMRRGSREGRGRLCMR